MGIDPITHRPAARFSTDHHMNIFSTLLPQYLALANNLININNPNLEQQLHATLMMTSPQSDHQYLSKLHYLHYLLQPTSNPTINTIPQNINSSEIHDQIISSNSIINSTSNDDLQLSHYDDQLPALMPLHDHSSLSSSSGLMINQDHDFHSSMLNQNDPDHHRNNMFSSTTTIPSSWANNSNPNISSAGVDQTNPSPPSDMAALAALISSMNGDACSSSTAPLVWPDLLFDENLFPENIAL